MGQRQPAPATPARQASAEAAATPSFSVESARRYLDQLAGELGSRASGSEEEAAAAEYLAQIFKQLGYEVEIQPFTYSVQGVVSRVDLDAGYSAIGFRFPGSADHGIRARLVDVPGLGQPADFEAAAVRGRIAIVDRGEIEFHVKASHAEAAGAVALIIVNRLASESLGGSLGAYSSKIPVLQMIKQDGDDLRARLAVADVEAVILNASPATGVSRNVIARKLGGRCLVVVGGHYDTVPEVSGANDNASGTALMLAFAEAWSAHPAAADLCFVGFGAEELGLHGSEFFVQEMQASGALELVTAMLNLDAIGDGNAPYRIIASGELGAMVNAVSEALQIDASRGSLPMMLGSDHLNFDWAGVPVVFPFPLGGIMHTPLDNLDNIDHEVYADIATLSHSILSCLLLQAGSPVIPNTACVNPN